MVELIIDASNSTFTKKSHMAGFPIDGHICQLEFLYDFGVGHAPNSGAPYTFILTS